MLPKGDADTTLKHRGLTLFSALYRTESGAYWHMYRKWMEDSAHSGIYGAISGRECLDDAWALQAAIEKAILSNAQLSGCLLDYIKFFDYFEVEFA